MNTSRTASLRGFGKAALAALLIVLVCFSAFAAGDASLHHWLHTDQSPSHECLITALAKGQTDFAVPSVVIFVPLQFTFVDAPAPLLTRGARTHLLPEPRGPPALS